MTDLIGEDRPQIKDVVRNEKILHTDLHQLHQKARLNYEGWAKFQFPNNGGTMVPYYHLVNEFSQNDNPYKDLFTSIKENWDKLALTVFPIGIHYQVEDDPTEANKSAEFVLGGGRLCFQTISKRRDSGASKSTRKFHI